MLTFFVLVNKPFLKNVYFVKVERGRRRRGQVKEACEKDTFKYIILWDSYCLLWQIWKEAFFSFCLFFYFTTWMRLCKQILVLFEVGFKNICLKKRVKGNHFSSLRYFVHKFFIYFSSFYPRLQIRLHHIVLFPLLVLSFYIKWIKDQHKKKSFFKKFVSLLYFSKSALTQLNKNF